MWITPEGLEKVKAELDHLWKVERPETTQKVAWAASLGDRSENADYHYNKKRLREIDKRVHYLRKFPGLGYAVGGQTTPSPILSLNSILKVSILGQEGRQKYFKL